MIRIWITKAEEHGLYGQSLDDVTIDDNGTRISFACERDDIPLALYKQFAAINHRREIAAAEHRGDRSILAAYGSQSEAEAIGALFDLSA